MLCENVFLIAVERFVSEGIQDLMEPKPIVELHTIQYTILLMHIFVLPSPLWGQNTANLLN